VQFSGEWVQLFRAAPCQWVQFLSVIHWVQFRRGGNSIIAPRPLPRLVAGEDQRIPETIEFGQILGSVVSPPPRESRGR
jgi:hypothetical protein